MPYSKAAQRFFQNSSTNLSYVIGTALTKMEYRVPIEEDVIIHAAKHYNTQNPSPLILESPSPSSINNTPLTWLNQFNSELFTTKSLIRSLEQPNSHVGCAQALHASLRTHFVLPSKNTSIEEWIDCMREERPPYLKPGLTYYNEEDQRTLLRFAEATGVNFNAIPTEELETLDKQARGILLDAKKTELAALIDTVEAAHPTQSEASSTTHPTPAISTRVMSGVLSYVVSPFITAVFDR